MMCSLEARRAHTLVKEEETACVEQLQVFIMWEIEYVPFDGSSSLF